MGAEIEPGIDPETLFDGITASELDAAVELGVLDWAHVTRFAVDRLVDGWDTPMLRELAGEPTDWRRVEERRVAPRWHRALDELDLPRADTHGRAVMIHAGHVLRLWREERVDLHAALDVVADLRPPIIPSSPLDAAIWIIDILYCSLTYAEEQERDPEIPGLRRAAELALSSLAGTITALARESGARGES